MQLQILKNTAFCVALHFGFGIATEVPKGIRRCMLQKLPKNRLCLRPGLTTVSLLLLTLHLPCLGQRRLPKVCQLWILQQEKEPPQVARSRQKKKERNQTRRKKQTMRMPTRRMKKRIWIKYCRYSRRKTDTHFSL